jgi:transcriptional regulator with XRE-family HTH domain
VTALHTATPFGEVLRTWRQRRKLSQLDLAVDAGVSARHVSFMETGRSAPSRAMVLKLAEVLDVPLRERNQLLVAAGLAPIYPERSLDHPELAAVRDGVQRVLSAYDPYPCVALDRHWNILDANAAAAVLLDGVAPWLLEQPNALRLALHPDGLAPRIKNLGQWRDHLVGRLRREVAASGSGELAALLVELESYPAPLVSPDSMAVAVPLELCTDSGELLTFISTVTTFGTALDLTVAELSIEAFLPADDATAAALVCRSASLGSPQSAGFGTPSQQNRGGA